MHSVYITDRGGAKVLIHINALTELVWSRKVDSISEATLIIAGEDCRSQEANLGMIEARRHEIVIYRGKDRVWEGPIVNVTWGLNMITIHARDVLEYLDGRAISKYWPGPENGGPELMGDRIEEIIRYELANSYDAPGASPAAIVPAWEDLDPPIDVLDHLEVTPGNVATRTETLPFEMSVFEHLHTLAEGGLDYTTVGRKIIIWDSSEQLGITRTMTASDFSGNIAIDARGSNLVAVQHVIANPQEEEDEEFDPNSTVNVGSAVRDLSYYGPWAKIHTRSEDDGNTPSQSALRTQALALSVRGIPLPTEIKITGNSTLLLNETLTIQHLVAGVSVPVLAEVSGRTLNQVQRFSQIQVTENSQGENISVSLMPAGEVFS